MRRRQPSLIVLCGVFATAAVIAARLQQAPPAPRPGPVFRSGINLILVDVVVRDKSGAVIKDLTADDFDLLEDGVRRPILTFAFEEIKPTAAPVENATTLAAAGGASRRGLHRHLFCPRFCTDRLA